MYVMRNTNNTGTALITSGSDLEAEIISNENLDSDNYVVIEGNYIKSVTQKDKYFTGTTSGVSLDDGTSYTISEPDSSGNVTIRYTLSSWGSTTYYYLKQTSNTAVSMGHVTSGNLNWYFYPVEKKYVVVE